MKATFFELKQFEKDYVESKLADLKGSLELEYVDVGLNAVHTPQKTDSDILVPFVDSRLDKSVIEKFP
ncbi:MAG: hypothetical protein WC797_03945, partial [Candidatus Paceibacterota bacterium]